MKGRPDLGVSLDHVATLRQLGTDRTPELVQAALIAEQAGAEQILIHLREDRRHVQLRDLQLLRATVTGRLNLRMPPIQEMIQVAYEHKPDVVTLVAERRESWVIEGGLDVARNRDSVRKYVQYLRDGEMQVCLLVDPDLEQIRAAHKIEAQAVEIHTGKYAEMKNLRERRAELERIVDACKLARKLGLAISASQGLDYRNVGEVVDILEIDELNIGHAIVARALVCGLDQAVREMAAQLMRR